ncbi:ANTAR domain-containing protein [Nocardiopsis ansamitocini]|uniref:ANTAR domain-containing protein n=1 Tax=Nocardiopsis ansamitocini TaxID=1670832 RepID=A0A9W6PAJ9_9ACTN|nr:ANTAR domain-containing protein [Nocardiopsis ansamitocini]GLU50002.1 hypothetical protein Nans01_43530 [Nocardiopsis ansamitocini]
MAADATPETAADVVADEQARIHRLETQVHHLTAALETRGVIGRGLGIIMGLHRCDSDEAFRLLRHASQDTNTKVHDIAAGLEAVTGDPLHDMTPTLRRALEIVVRQQRAVLDPVAGQPSPSARPWTTATHPPGRSPDGSPRADAPSGEGRAKGTTTCHTPRVPPASGPRQPERSPGLDAGTGSAESTPKEPSAPKHAPSSSRTSSATTRTPAARQAPGTRPGPRTTEPGPGLPKGVNEVRP